MAVVRCLMDQFGTQKWFKQTEVVNKYSATGQSVELREIENLMSQSNGGGALIRDLYLIPSVLSHWMVDSMTILVLESNVFFEEF